MGFFSRLAFGWRLAMTSLGVVGRDKTLMLFPILSGIASALLIAGFVIGIGPEQLAAWAEQAGAETDEATPGAFYALTFGIYLLLYIITVYFNVALLGAARASIGGADTGVGDGLAVANQHLGKILGWSLLSATIGILINMLESNEKIGRFVAAVLGTAWTVISYFALPVMIFENESAVGAIGRSARLMKSTWGENVGAQFGVGLAMFAFLTLAVVLCVGGSLLLPQAELVLLPLLLVTVPVILLLGAAAKAVLAVGLYQYAVGERDGGVFATEELRAAFH